MNTKVTLSNGVKCIAVSGMIPAAEAADFADFIDTVLTDGNVSIYWQLSDLDQSIDAGSAANFVEAFARLRAADIGLVLLNAPDSLVSYLTKAGMGNSISLVSSERDALIAVFNRFEKKYDDAFFQLLIKEGLITKAQLAMAHAEFDKRNGEVPIDELMLEMNLLTVEDILKVMAHRKSFLGEILVDTGLISQETLNSVLEIQKTKGGKIGDLLKSVGAISDRDIYEALAIQYWRKMELNGEDNRPVNEVDLLGFLSSNDYLIISDAEERLIAMGSEVVPFLLKQLDRKELSVEPSILRILGEIRDYKSLPALHGLLSSDDPIIQDEAYWALVKITGSDLPPSATWRWGRVVKKLSAQGSNIPPTTPADNDETAKILNDLAEGRTPLTDTSIEYESGRVNWEGGKVNLLITGEGKVFLKRNCRGDVTLLSKTIAPERMKDLLANLEKYNITAVKTSRSFGTVDEPRNSYTLRLGNNVRKSVFYWATEMYGSLQLMNIENITRMLLNFLEL